MAASKFVPVMVTAVPARPIEGEKLVIVGAVDDATVNTPSLDAVVPPVVTVIRPEVAPLGTAAMISVAVDDNTVAEVPLK